MAASASRKPTENPAELRAAGLRPVTVWVPDLTNPDIVAEYRRQAELVAAADARDDDTDSFSEAALAELDLPPYEER